MGRHQAGQHHPVEAGQALDRARRRRQGLDHGGPGPVRRDHEGLAVELAQLGEAVVPLLGPPGEVGALPPEEQLGGEVGLRRHPAADHLEQAALPPAVVPQPDRGTHQIGGDRCEQRAGGHASVQRAGVDHGAPRVGGRRTGPGGSKERMLPIPHEAPIVDAVSGAGWCTVSASTIATRITAAPSQPRTPRRSPLA